MKLNPEIEVELIFDDKELDLSTRQADIGIFMRRPKQLNYIQRKLMDINYHIYGSNKYLEQYGIPKTVNDLNKHRFISYCFQNFCTIHVNSHSVKFRISTNNNSTRKNTNLV